MSSRENRKQPFVSWRPCLASGSILSRTRAKARARKAGAIARCLRWAFFRAPYGILDRIEPRSPIMLAVR
jgi:hypothetical protein